MILFYIIICIISLIYVFSLCLCAIFAYKDYKERIPILLIPEGLGKILWLLFPVYLPFVLASYFRILKNKSYCKKNRKSVLTSMFSGDEKEMKEFEKKISCRYGVFDISLYSILDSFNDMKESEITYGKLHSKLTKLILENNIKIDKEDIPQVALDLLSCFYIKKYDETDTQRMIRLRKAGFNIRLTHLGRNEDKHFLKCDFDGKETECPKDCGICAIGIKKIADTYLKHKQYNDAIEKYLTSVQIEPNFAEAWNNLGLAYENIGNQSSSLKAYLKAVDIDPMYGDALWGAATVLRNLGRDAEAMKVLKDLLKYYNYPEANDLVAELEQNKIIPIPICRDVENRCIEQITLVARFYGLDCPSNLVIDPVAKTMFEEVFTPFFDYLIDSYKTVVIEDLVKASSMTMLLAGMVSNKFYREEKAKVMPEGILKLLSKPNGIGDLDEYYCDCLNIQYGPNNRNELSPCLDQMAQEAIRIYSNIIKQVITKEQIKVLVHDFSYNFFMLGFNFIDSKQNNKLPIIKPKNLSEKELLSLRLKILSNDPAIKADERPRGVSFNFDLLERHYRCDICGRQYVELEGPSLLSCFDEIRKMGYDCKLERWCGKCYADAVGLGRLVFSIRFNSNEAYRRTAIDPPDLVVLCHFFKNENLFFDLFGRAHFVGEFPEIVARILGLNLITIEK